MSELNYSCARCERATYYAGICAWCHELEDALELLERA